MPVYLLWGECRGREAAAAKTVPAPAPAPWLTLRRTAVMRGLDPALLASYASYLNLLGEQI